MGPQKTAASSRRCLILSLTIWDMPDFLFASSGSLLTFRSRIPRCQLASQRQKVLILTIQFAPPDPMDFDNIGPANEGNQLSIRTTQPDYERPGLLAGNLHQSTFSSATTVNESRKLNGRRLLAHFRMLMRIEFNLSYISRKVQ